MGTPGQPSLPALVARTELIFPQVRVRRGASLTQTSSRRAIKGEHRSVMGIAACCRCRLESACTGHMLRPDRVGCVSVDISCLGRHPKRSALTISATAAGTICSQDGSPLWMRARTSGVRMIGKTRHSRESVQCDQSPAARPAGGAREAVSAPAPKRANLASLPVTGGVHVHLHGALEQPADRLEQTPPGNSVKYFSSATCRKAGSPTAIPIIPFWCSRPR